MLRIKENEVEIEVYKLRRINTTWSYRKCGETTEYDCGAQLLLKGGLIASLVLEMEEYEKLEKVIRSENTNCILSLKFKEIYIC